MKNGRPAILRSSSLFSFFFFLFSLFSWAQDGETRFIQRIVWNEDEYARRYEVIIEREEGETYSELRRESTPEPFIETPLMPGKYRCRVIPHNFLNQPGEASEWMYIEVLAALNPELDDMVPSFFLSKAKSGDTLYEMRVSGKNLLVGAEIFLRASGGKRIVPVDIQTGKDGSHVRLFFKNDQLITGIYELIVINPGGLQVGKGGITFPPPEPIAKDQKKVDLFLSAAWMPSFTIYDEGDSPGSFAGAVGRFGMVMARSFFNFKVGVELAASYNFFNTSYSGQDALHLWGFALNLLAQNWFPNEKMALTFRLGAGYSLRFHTNMGVSFLLFVMEHLYMETGLDYAHWFTNPPSGCFRPWLGAGWRF